MTVKLVVLYTQPEDPQAFDRHYFDTHMPLVRKIPGLQRAETARFTAAVDGGEVSYYRSAELYFADAAAMDAGLRTPEGKATGKDFMQIAAPGSRMFAAEVDAD
jgi:uncharacterized protein (TIGR02118 family)